MIDINKEAEEYAKEGSWQCPISFIAGGNSKYVQAKILQAQIDVLQSQFDKLEMGITQTKSISETETYTTPEIKLIQGDILYQIENLKQQLNKLENE